jgi:hypothetical protein
MFSVYAVKRPYFVVLEEERGVRCSEYNTGKRERRKMFGV